MRLSVPFALLCCASLALVGCSSSATAGHALFPTKTHAKTSKTSSSRPDFPTGSAPVTDVTDSAGTGGGCVPGADYCDTFDDPSSGWPVDNPSHFYAKYDSYLGGSYRMGERTNAAVSEDAPYKATEAANDYSVQVDVDAVLGSGFGADDEIGIDCWEHPIEGGGGLTTAFLLQISSSTAEIGLWDGTDGTYRKIAAKPAPDVLHASGTNHLTALCIQGVANGGVQAQLSLAVNGTTVVTATYAKSTRTYEWGVGDGLGLLAIGQGSDVFYDNFAVTGRCTGDYC